MKRFAIIIIACAATAAFTAAPSVSADTGVNIPESFAATLSLNNVSDYSVGENRFAFADGNDIYVYICGSGTANGYSDGTLDKYTHVSTVVRVEYDGAETLCFSDSAGGVYRLADGSVSETTFTFSSDDNGEYRLYENSYVYYLNNKNFVCHNTDTTHTETTGGNFRKLRENKYDNGDYTGFVLNGNELYGIKDGSATALELGYENPDAVSSIAVADAAQKLKEPQNTELVTVKGDACLIRIDPDELGGEYFKTDQISYASDGTVAQLLAYSGNAAIISIGNRAYLTLASNVAERDYQPSATGSAYAYALTGAGLYSRPYASEGTRLYTLTSGNAVKITGEVTGAAFGNDFCFVEFNDGEQTVTGYVIRSFLSPYTFADEENDNQAQGGEAEYGNMVQTVALVMVIVVLVIIAVCYITFAGTKNNRGGGRKKNG